MKILRLPSYLLLALIALAALSGCGNKGDLVHPDKTPAPASP